MNSFIDSFLEVQQTLVPKVFQCYLIEARIGKHPLPHKFFDINEENFILVSKKHDENISVMLLSASCNEENVDISGELGSPLELYDYQKDLQLNPCYEDVPSNTAATKEILHPLSQSEAGCILSFYNIGFQKHTGIQPWRIWVISDGSQKEGFVFRSSLVQCLDDGRKAIDSFYVTSRGHFFDTSHVNLIQSLLPQRYFNAEFKMDFSSSYCLYGSDEDTTSTKVKVKFSWEEESAILCPPPVDANAVLLIEIDEEGYFGPLTKFRQELSIVEKLVEGVTEEVVLWPVSSSLPRPPEKIASFITSIQEHSSKTCCSKNQAEKSRKSIFNISPCSEVDFTDEVWNIMKDCSSYQELLDCFKSLFEAIQNKKLQPLLGSNNQSSLAQLIRGSYSSNIRKEAMTWLKDEKPLIMLAEIGIEKLKKDYLFNFMTSGIVTAIQLAYYLGNLDSDGLAEKLNKLRRLHRILELCLVLDQNLIMQRSSLVEVLSFSLKHYESLDTKEDLKMPFEMPISVLSVIEQVKKTSPSTWECRIFGCLDSRNNSIQGCILLSRNPIFHHINCNILQEPNDGEGHLYYHVSSGKQTVTYY